MRIQGKNKIVFDIDDVVRDLNKLITNRLGHNAENWEEGHVIHDIVRCRPEVLVEAGETPYAEVVKKYVSCPLFLSNQASSWQPYTNIWLDNHFDNYNVIYTNSFIEKEDLCEEVILVDDFPAFSDYNNVALVDMSYNREVKQPLKRIKSPKDLMSLIKEYGTCLN